MDPALLIQEYSKNPVNNYEMIDYTVFHQEWNAICWDWINVYLRISNSWIVEKFSFTGDTSMVTTAAVSLLAENIEWMSIDNILSLDFNYMEWLWLEVSPRRKRSVVLWLLATRNAIHNYLKDGLLDDFDDLWVD